MAFFVTASAPLLCPLCRRSNVEYKRNDFNQSWKFFCYQCKAGAEIKQVDIVCSHRGSTLIDLLREKLVASLGRANKIEPMVQSEGPSLQLAPGQEPSPTVRKKKDPPKIGKIEVPPYEEADLPKLWDRKKNPNKRVQQRTKIRQALQRAQRTILEDEDE